MGNSGSINGLSAYDDGYHHHHHHHQQQQQQQQHHSHAGYHQHHQRYHDAMRGGAGLGPIDGPGWLESYHQQRSEQHDLHWNSSSTSPGHHQQQQQQQQQQQIKVLPDIPGKVAKLRSTNNGNILHAGGTISKNNQLQRSKSISSPSYQQHHHHHHQQRLDEALEMGSGEQMCSLPPRMLITRSRTQVSMLGVGSGGPAYDGETTTTTTAAALRRPPQFGSRGPATRQPASYQSGAGAGATPHGPGGIGGQRKRFGSEPDLRAPHEGPPKEHTEGAGASGAGLLLRTPKTAQSKIMKGKNKKKAPGPPIALEKQKDPGKGESGERGGRIIAYSPLRKTNSDTSSTLPSSSTEQSGGGGGGVGGGRKLRLFKTRAETRKQPVIAKLPEASDAKFAKAKVQQQQQQQQNSATSTARKLDRQLDPGVGEPGSGDRVVLEQIPAQPNPRSFFRREKTFDVGLLSLESRKAARYQLLEPPGATRPTLSPPLSRRKSIVKSLLEAEPQQQQQQQQELLDKRQRSSVVAAATATTTTSRKDLSGQQQQQQARRKPSQASKEVDRAIRETRYPVTRVLHPGKGAPNTLVIPVEPAEDSLPSPPPPPQPPTVAAATEAVPSTPPPPPPPPPPAPKSSFYFGMSTVAPIGGSSAAAAATEEPERDRGTTEEEEEEEEQEQVVEEKVEQRASGLSRSGSLDEIDRTQMDIIDRFAASLLHDSRRFHSTDSVASSEADLRAVTCVTGHLSPTTDESAMATSDGQEIALRLRPTLPRKQFDIPRFSPAAAWRLLTTEDEFGPVDETPGSGAGDKKQPYLRGTELDGASSEDRIERVYREPGLPGIQDNKSGDSGISGDAEGLPDLGEPQHRHHHRAGGKKGGGRHEPSPDSSPLMGSSAEEKEGHDGGGGGDGRPTNNNNNNNGWSSSALTRLTPWTPQQDLDDDDDTTTGGSSSDQHHQHQQQQHELLHHRLHHRLLDDTGIDHHHHHHNDFTTKGHLFSLSLPRENHLSIYNAGGSADDKIEKHVFNSLQKLRKSVSDAFRSPEDATTGGPVSSNDNWFLGRLDTSKTRTPRTTMTPVGSYDKRPGYGLPIAAQEQTAGVDVVGDDETTPLGRHSGPKISSSSIGYLVSGRHVMYLPKEPTRLHPVTPTPVAAAAAVPPAAKHAADHNNNSTVHSMIGNRNAGGHLSAWDSSQQQQQHQSSVTSSSAAAVVGSKISAARIRGQASERQQIGGATGFPGVLPPHENKENLQDTVPVVGAGQTGAGGAGATEQTGECPGSTGGTSLPVKLSNRRHHRFTFQSTIRQIEKRRVAEKLSREAEIKEAMRLSELEAMRRVEEEFQRKRAREKASIRHQLRLFSMEENDGQHQQRYDDDNADDNDPGRNEAQTRAYGDGKRSDPDGDSLPHQSARPGRGLYRKRDSSTTIERQQQQQQQYKRSLIQDPYHDDDDDDDEDGDGDNNDDNGVAAAPDRDDNDGDSSSSLGGYVDTRTPYISRIIQAKSSKSGGGYGLHKLRAD